MRYSARHSMPKPSKNISNFDIRTAGQIGKDHERALSAILETGYLHPLPAIEFNNSTELRSAGKPA
jgi:hypothetical protein